VRPRHGCRTLGRSVCGSRRGRALKRPPDCDTLARRRPSPEPPPVPRRAARPRTRWRPPAGGAAAAALCALAIGLAGAPLRAAHGADFALCGPGLVLPPAPVIADPSPRPGVVDVEADDADLRDEGLSILRGNVVLERDTATLSADEVRYARDTDTVDAIGSLEVWDQGLYLQGTRGRMVVPEDVTVVEDARYRILEAHAHGSSSRVVLSGSDVVKADDATYSTCNPGQEDWVLEADRIRLDKVEDQGTARNVWVVFKGVPIFYSPFLTFPLSDARKSGFLTPSAGASSSTGAEATVPYYFNIAPNLDATLAARAMANRGVQAQGEFRYLFPWGRGILAGEVMPQDTQRDESRSAVSLRHASELGPHWDTDLIFDWVSDDEYFEDLGTSLAVSSQSFLEQRLEARYNASNIHFLARLQGFQTVDSSLPGTSRPFERLPQLLASTSFRERNLRPNVNARAEVVHFDRRDSVTGVRVDLAPYVTLPYRTAAGFVVPRATLRYTAYALDDQPAGDPNDPSRLLPTFSLDSGLFFERRLRFASRGLLQTLEPRLFYLYRPFERQDDLPVFDTGVHTFSFAQLFREDRFTGADRAGDAHQVTLALTTRILDAGSGAELLRASVGQIRHLRDRKVTLPGEPIETRSGSDLVAEISASLDRRWRATAGIQWDPSETRTNRNTVAVRYQPDARRVVNASYRFVRDAVEQTDLSVAWPIAGDWRAVGRWNYSLDAERSLEIFGGVEYESCCWGLRLVARRFLATTDGEYNTGVFAQLVLKGLTAVGDADEFLGRSIPGYRNEF